MPVSATLVPPSADVTKTMPAYGGNGHQPTLVPALTATTFPLLEKGLPPTPEGRHRFTREACQLLEDAGLMSHRYELIDGEVYDKVSQYRPHAKTVSRMFRYLLGLFNEDRIQTQATMGVNESDNVTNGPEPDLVILREEFDESLKVPPGEDVILAIEVSDTTQNIDFGKKPALYARAGVQEYWVVDIPRRVLTIFRDPQGGEWQDRSEYTEEDTVAPLAAPDHPVQVARLLP